MQWSRVSAGVAGLFLALTTIAAPAGAAERDPRLAQVQAQVTELEARAESAAEDWNRARAQLAESLAKVTALQRKAAQARDSYAAVSKDLGRLVGGLYRSGMIDLDVQTLFSDNPTQFLQQMAAVQQIGSAQAIALKRIAARRLSLTQAESAVRAEQVVAQRLTKQAAAHKLAADRALARAAQLLGSLQAAERARLAAMHRARAAAAARRATHARATGTASLATVSTRVKRILSYALSKVGNRYNFGSAGPSSFDCSGLVMASYHTIGIGLPHYARGQYSATRRVSRGSLRPGDLVFFFGRGIQHVGIYIGRNQFVHAANYQDGVIVTSLSDPYYVMRTSGYGRVVR
ncbi:MAG: C40 family peptidase [Candidatus Nanopelagicales bacterium]